jgi:hypothetical protein
MALEFPVDYDCHRSGSHMDKEMDPSLEIEA